MIKVKNAGRRPLMLDTTIKITIRTMRPPVGGAYEKLEDGDTLEIDVGYDVTLTIMDDILSIRPTA